MVFKAALRSFELPGAGSAEEPEVVCRHGQGCVEPLQGFEVPNVPLSAPTGVRLAPTSPMLVEGAYCEVGLPVYGVLRSSACLWHRSSVIPAAPGLSPEPPPRML